MVQTYLFLDKRLSQFSLLCLRVPSQLMPTFQGVTYAEFTYLAENLKKLGEVTKYTLMVIFSCR